MSVSCSAYQDTLSIRATVVKMAGKYTQPALMAGQPWQREVIVEPLKIPIAPRSDTLTGRREDGLGRVIQWNPSRARTASAR